MLVLTISIQITGQNAHALELPTPTRWQRNTIIALSIVKRDFHPALTHGVPIPNTKKANRSNHNTEADMSSRKCFLQQF